MEKRKGGDKEWGNINRMINFQQSRGKVGLDRLVIRFDIILFGWI